MWIRLGLLVVGCIVGVALAFDREVAKEQITEYRVRSQNLHIDQLEEKVHALEEKFGHLSPEVTKADMNRLKTRLRRLGGQKCPKNEVSCGGDWPECVHHLLVCDGVKDCHNGRDEIDFVCNDDIVKEGSAFSGVMHWKSCMPLADHNTFITITAMHRAPFYRNRAFVRAQIANDIGGEFLEHQQHSYTARGYFVFASRQLVLIPDANAPHRFGIVCSFHFGDYDHADCRVVTEAAKRECGRMRVSREYKDMDHHVEWHH